MTPVSDREIFVQRANVLRHDLREGGHEKDVIEWAVLALAHLQESTAKNYARRLSEVRSFLGLGSEPAEWLAARELLLQVRIENGLDAAWERTTDTAVNHFVTYLLSGNRTVAPREVEASLEAQTLRKEDLAEKAEQARLQRVAEAREKVRAWEEEGRAAAEKVALALREAEEARGAKERARKEAEGRKLLAERARLRMEWDRTSAQIRMLQASA